MRYGYSGIFFKEILSYGSFHISEVCQHYFLYWPLHPKHFLHWRNNIFPPLTVFSTQAHIEISMLCQLTNMFFLLKHASTFTSRVLLKFHHHLFFSATQDLMTNRCSIWFSLFILIVSKQYFFWSWNNFFSLKRIVSLRFTHI